MPIVGMTDAATAVPKFPLLGRLRKGAPKQGNRPGKDLDYFRFDPARPEVGEAFDACYGEKLMALDVYLPYALISDCFPTWREEWTAGGLVHRCDGETCSLWRKTDGNYSTAPKACPYLQATGSDKKCVPVGRLNLILPGLLRAGYVGYVTLGTGSINDIVSIHSALLAVVEAAGIEDLRGIAWQLYRQTEAISTPDGKGGRARREKSLVKLVPAVQWIRGQLAASARKALALPDVDLATGEVVSAPEPMTLEEPEDLIEAEAVEEQEPEGYADRFLSRAIENYSVGPAAFNEDDILAAIALTREQLDEMGTAGTLDTKALKKALDEKLGSEALF